MIENEVKQKVISALLPFFNIRDEVWDMEHKSRIDLIVQCKKSAVNFGIELKRIDKKTGENIGQLIEQAIRYSKCKFNCGGNYVKIPIFVAPPISLHLLGLIDARQEIDCIDYFQDRHTERSEHHTINGMLGVFNVGEIRTIDHFPKKYFIFSFSNHTIWSSKIEYGTSNYKGLHLENYSKLISKING